VRFASRRYADRVRCFRKSSLHRQKRIFRQDRVGPVPELHCVKGRAYRISKSPRLAFRIDKSYCDDGTWRIRRAAFAVNPRRHNCVTVIEFHHDTYLLTGSQGAPRVDNHDSRFQECPCDYSGPNLEYGPV
jgi:hypothetical protein